MLNEQARELLEQKQFAVLATINRDGSPQQTVMWYELIGGHIMMNTEAGRLKEFNVRRDPHVSICVEDEYNYVTINGHAELDEDPDAPSPISPGWPAATILLRRPRNWPGNSGTRSASRSG